MHRRTKSLHQHPTHNQQKLSQNLNDTNRYIISSGNKHIRIHRFKSRKIPNQ
ncbi:hypothetical protein Hanom_Chr16g01429871 [Helianthus anomalus]